VLQRHFATIAFPASPVSYDIICESYSGNFIKCQVKTCSAVSVVNDNIYWRFHSGMTSGVYKKSDTDFFAFVALPLRLIIFKSVDEVDSVVFRLRETEFTERAEIESLENTLGKHL